MNTADIIVRGPVGSGKSTLSLLIVEMLRSEGIECKLEGETESISRETFLKCVESMRGKTVTVRTEQTARTAFGGQKVCSGQPAAETQS